MVYKPKPAADWWFCERSQRNDTFRILRGIILMQYSVRNPDLMTCTPMPVIAVASNWIRAGTGKMVLWRITRMTRSCVRGDNPIRKTELPQRPRNSWGWSCFDRCA